LGEAALEISSCFPSFFDVQALSPRSATTPSEIGKRPTAELNHAAEDLVDEQDRSGTNLLITSLHDALYARRTFHANLELFNGPSENNLVPDFPARKLRKETRGRTSTLSVIFHLPKLITSQNEQHLLDFIQKLHPDLRKYVATVPPSQRHVSLAWEKVSVRWIEKAGEEVFSFMETIGQLVPPFELRGGGINFLMSQKGEFLLVSEIFSRYPINLRRLNILRDAAMEVLKSDETDEQFWGANVPHETDAKVIRPADPVERAALVLEIQQHHERMLSRELDESREFDLNTIQIESFAGPGQKHVFGRVRLTGGTAIPVKPSTSASRMTILEWSLSWRSRNSTTMENIKRSLPNTRMRSGPSVGRMGGLICAMPCGSGERFGSTNSGASGWNPMGSWWLSINDSEKWAMPAPTNGRCMHAMNTRRNMK